MASNIRGGRFEWDSKNVLIPFFSSPKNVLIPFLGPVDQEEFYRKGREDGEDETALRG